MKKRFYWLTFLRFLLVLVLFSITRVVFYGYNSHHFAPIPFLDFLYMMQGGVRFDLTALIYLNSLFLIVNFLPIVNTSHPKLQKGLFYLFMITNGIGLAFNFLDFNYYPFTLKRTTASIFDFLGGESNIIPLFWSFLKDYWYTILLFIATIYFMSKAYHQIGRWFVFDKRPNPSSKIKRYSSQVLIFLLLIFFAIGGIRGGWANSTRPITLSNAGAYVNKPEEMAIVLNTPFAIMRTLGKSALKTLHYFETSDPALKLFNPIKTPHKMDRMKREKKNLVIFILESFGKESFGFYNKDLEGGSYKGYTPFLDSLLEESWSFNSFANGRKSIDGLPAVIASIPAFNKPFILSQHSGNDFDGLGELLQKDNYETAFFHGAANGSMGFDAFVKLAGYQKYFGRSEYNNDDDYDGTWGIWDEPFLQFQTKVMDQLKQPFLTTTFTLSSHHPFKVPSKYEGKFPKGTQPIHQGIGYTDYALKQFFKVAKKKDWFKNTLFVITCDHSNQNTYSRYNTTVGVFEGPVFFYTPDGSLKSQSNEVAQQIDIMPTALSLLGFDQPFFSFGNDLTDPNQPRFAISWIGQSYQMVIGEYVIHFDLKKTTGLYHYKKDRLLENNLVGKLPEVQEKMETFLKAYIQQFHEAIVNNNMAYNR